MERPLNLLNSLLLIGAGHLVADGGGADGDLLLGLHQQRQGPQQRWRRWTIGGGLQLDPADPFAQEFSDWRRSAEIEPAAGEQGADQVGRALCKTLVEQRSVFTVVERWLPATVLVGLWASGSVGWTIDVSAGLCVSWPSC